MACDIDCQQPLNPTFNFTGENKATIRKSGIQEKLMELEKYQDSSLTKFREVGFCAQWCLDNTCKCQLFGNRALLEYRQQVVDYTLSSEK